MRLRLLAGALVALLACQAVGRAAPACPVAAECAPAHPRGRGLRNAGIALTVIGIVALQGAIALWALSRTDSAPGRRPVGRGDGGEEAGATALTLASGALLGAGIPMWVIGSAEAHREITLSSRGLEVRF